jgi:hypothetical protein
MFKRLFWLTVGAGFGFGASFWVTRAVRTTMARLSPTRVSNELTSTVRAAVSEGRAAMRQRERELRTEVEKRYERTAGRPVA